MANTVVNYRYPVSGLTLTLHLRATTAAADPLNGSGGDAFTESVTESGFYSTTVSEALAGSYWFQIKLGSTVIDQGFCVLADTVGPFFVNEQAVQDSQALLSRISASVATMFTQLVTMIIGNQFTADALEHAPTGSGEGGGEVTGFSTGALSQLAGLQISFTQPTFDGSEFTTPFVFGDSYQDDLAPLIVLTNWPGRDPTAAATITLQATHVNSGTVFDWTADAALMAGTTYSLTVDVAWGDADEHPPGVYTFRVLIEWTSPTEVATPIVGARLTVTAGAV